MGCKCCPNKDFKEASLYYICCSIFQMSRPKNLELSKIEFTELDTFVSFWLQVNGHDRTTIKKQYFYHLVGKLFGMNMGSISNNLFKPNNPAPSLNEQAFHLFSKKISTLFASDKIYSFAGYATLKERFEKWNHEVRSKFKAGIENFDTIDINDLPWQTKITANRKRMEDYLKSNPIWILLQGKRDCQFIEFIDIDHAAGIGCKIYGFFDYIGVVYCFSPYSLVALPKQSQRINHYFHLAVSFGPNSVEYHLASGHYTFINIFGREPHTINTHKVILIRSDRIALKEFRQEVKKFRSQNRDGSFKYLPKNVPPVVVEYFSLPNQFLNSASSEECSIEKLVEYCERQKKFEEYMSEQRRKYRESRQRSKS